MSFAQAKTWARACMRMCLDPSQCMRHLHFRPAGVWVCLHQLKLWHPEYPSPDVSQLIEHCRSPVGRTPLEPTHAKIRRIPSVYITLIFFFYLFDILMGHLNFKTQKHILDFINKKEAKQLRLKWVKKSAKDSRQQWHFMSQSGEDCWIVNCALSPVTQNVSGRHSTYIARIHFGDKYRDLGFFCPQVHMWPATTKSVWILRYGVKKLQIGQTSTLKVSFHEINKS